MKKFKTTIIVLIALYTSASLACVHEYKSSLDKIGTLANKYFSHDGITYHEASKFNFSSFKSESSDKEFYVQEAHGLAAHSSGDYNDRYLEYYTYAHMNRFIESTRSQWKEKGYKIEIIGKSLEGRNLYSIFPSSISKTKKTILMYGRHHGDEGTANWIIEGFVNALLAQNDNFFDEYQLILYPMINPDGAEARRRYNSKGKDLNRVWYETPSRSLDEIQIIHNDVQKKVLTHEKMPVIALDMHGSFTEDFIYRVSKTFKTPDFYNLQANFIAELGAKDIFQNGNAQTSNGHPKMGRILLVRDYGINALTHETPRDIRKTGNRQISDLKQQGIDVLSTIKQLY